MHRCIAIVTDMIFASRISGTAEKVGATCQVVRDADALRRALASDEPTTVLVDMQCEGVSTVDVIRTVKADCPNARVVAFCSHVQTELMEQAASAGADQVWPRSLFVQRLPDLLTATESESLDDPH